MSRRDRVIAKLVALIVRLVYREVEVVWAVRPSTDRPHLAVANHFGGVSDAIVLFAVLPRRPGVVARDAIWKVPVVGRLMDWVGAIPVHRADDGGGGSANDQMFASCYEQLRRGGDLLIFPEGVTRNEPSIAEVKTGAARIVLGARASGVEGVLITPLGIHYEDKAMLRKRVLVLAGPPLDVDAFAAQRQHAGGDGGADDRQAVHDLTARIDAALRDVAPDFAGWEEARSLTFGAEVALRTLADDPADPVPAGLRDRLANTLASRPASERRQMCDAVATYRSALDAVGVRDDDLAGRLRLGRLGVLLVVELLVALVLVPFALVGALIGAVPFLLVKLVGRWRTSPSMLATVKPIVAALAFGAMWAVVVALLWSRYGVTYGAAAIVLVPVYLGAAGLLADRVRLVVELLQRWHAGRRTGGVVELIATQRAAVVDAVFGQSYRAEPPLEVAADA